MNVEIVKEIARLTVELTRLRQNECKHLAVENVGPEIFGKLTREFLAEECGRKLHASDCALHNMPAYPNGQCDCGVVGI